MIYKVGLLGASGKMGMEVAFLLGSGHWVGEDLLELADAVTATDRFTRTEGVETRRLGDPPPEPVNVWIDFSRPEATLELLKETDRPIVIATTGFTDSQAAEIEAYSQKHPVLIASNTSIGMNLFRHFLNQLPNATKLPFDFVLSEEHHKEKKDAPSGTAKSLLGILVGKGLQDVAVQSTRAGGTRGVHTLRLVGEDEVLEIRHEAWSRKVFAQGAITAAHFLVQQKEPGIYSMEDALSTKGPLND